MAGSHRAGVPHDLELVEPASTLLEGGHWEPLTSGRWSRVWRVGFHDHRPALVVKAPPASSTARSVAEENESVLALRAEARRLSWASHHLPPLGVPVPELVVGLDDAAPPAATVLVTGELPGEADLRLLGSSERATKALADALAGIHGSMAGLTDAMAPPFDASLEQRLEEVAARVAAGLVDPADFPPPLQRYRPEDLLDRVRRMAEAAAAPAAHDLVVVHGDLCVTNLLVDPATGSATGVLDWGRSGLGDRHLDLAVTARSVVRNFGGEALPGFFAAYGELEPDPLRLELYALLEELA